MLFSQMLFFPIHIRTICDGNKCIRRFALDVKESKRIQCLLYLAGVLYSIHAAFAEEMCVRIHKKNRKLSSALKGIRTKRHIAYNFH